MSFESNFRGHLLAGVSSLVADRLYPITRTSTTLPAITYQVITQQPQNSIDGHTSGLTKYRVQIDCWATTFDGMLALKAAAKARMDIAAATFTSILEFGQDIYDDETKIYRSILDFSCGFKE